MLKASVFILLVSFAASVEGFQIQTDVTRRLTMPSTSRLQLNFDKNDDQNLEALASSYIPLACEGFGDDEIQLKFKNRMDFWDVLTIVTPIVFPLFAFQTYEDVAKLWQNCVELLSTKTWVAVDGGMYQAKIIAPAINGVVVPAIAVLFATLTSMTISSLRERQDTVHRSINMEAGELRALECILEEFPPGELKVRARAYLMQYTSRLISESSPRRPRFGDQDIRDPRRSMDSELNGLVSLLNKHVQQNERATAKTDTIPPYILSEVFSSVTSLRKERQTRITALQSYFPPLHYAVLVVLALSECTAFLIETNQEILVFLNAFQLRVLWCMLTSTFVACFALFSDLGAPFSGSYSVAASADQLETILLTLQACAIQDEGSSNETGRAKNPSSIKSGAKTKEATGVEMSLSTKTRRDRPKL